MTSSWSPVRPNFASRLSPAPSLPGFGAPQSFPAGAARGVRAEVRAGGLGGAERPSDAANALQSRVSRLRKALPVAIESGPGGYRLGLAGGDVDAERFEQLAADGRRELAAGRDAYAAEPRREALALGEGGPVRVGVD